MAHVSFQQEYMQIPVITRTYTTACLFTTLAVQMEIISPFQIYFNPDLIYNQYQIWRIVTNFLFFGKLEFNFFFNMLFLYRYCRMLEEGSFRGRTADMVFMFLMGGSAMCCIGIFVNLVFLGHAFTIMLVYIWSQRNPYVRMSFFGILTFRAPYLPWVLIGFSIMLGNPIIVDAIGIAAGHIYYFLEDVFPKQKAGFKILYTPRILKYLFDPPPDTEDYTTLPEAERPGGFAWGQPEEEPDNEENNPPPPPAAE